MPISSNSYHLRSIRVKEYDYSSEGAYFITLTTFKWAHLFGDIVAGAMELNTYGKIADEQWIRLQKRFPPCNFDSYIIMPNHIHGIIHIVKGAGEGFEHPTSRRGVGDESDQPSSGIPPLRPYHIPNLIPGSLGAIVRAYKASVAYRITAIRGYAIPSVWQRNYYEHIIRNEKEYQQIKDYIETNPATWMDDRLFVPENSN